MNGLANPGIYWTVSVCLESDYMDTDNVKLCS